MGPARYPSCPYTDAPDDSTYYRLEELDGTPLAGTFAGNRLKKFFPRAIRNEDRDARDSVLRAMDERIEAEQRSFAERHADRLRELQEMASASGEFQIDESDGT